MAFTVSDRIRSFHHAFAGVFYMLRTQHNAWIHTGATLTAIVAAMALRLTSTDWRWLIVAIALVWLAEAMNTAFEHLCDVVSPEISAAVQRSKDVAAGAVLICAAAALTLGVLIFWPYVCRR